MAIELLVAGLASSVQDAGRTGYYHVGIPPSGALDQDSLLAGNLLVGNPEDAAGIEAVYLGPTLRFDAPGRVAVTGAPAQLRLNGEPMPMWESLAVAADDVLEVGGIVDGARVYVVPAGGIDVPVVLGSRSTYGLGGLGGHLGRTLQAGDRLAVGASVAGGPAHVSVPHALRPTFAKEREVRVVMGLYDHLLTAQARECFVNDTWTLTPVADRVGLRYKGPALTFIERERPFGAGQDPSNIVDAAYPVGSIQVPGGLEPIVLHRDAVTGGGYAMIATVISADLDLVGQSAPGCRTRFVPIDLAAARAARAERRARLDRLRRAIFDQTKEQPPCPS